MAVGICRRRDRPSGYHQHRLEGLPHLCLLQPCIHTFRVLLLARDGKHIRSEWPV